MLNDDEDDDATVEVEDNGAAGVDTDDEAETDVRSVTAKPKRAAARKPAARKTALQARTPARSVAKAPTVKAAAKTSRPKKTAKVAKKRAATKTAKAPLPPAGLTGVKAGAHTIWVSKDLSRALTSKDRRKLKAVLRRAEKREKSKKT
jgi:hypothetical protein